MVLIGATALLTACLLPSRRFPTVLKPGRATSHRVTQQVELRPQQQDPERERREAAKLYLTAIKPVFAKACYHCHGPAKQSGGVRLDTVRAIRLGGDTGPIIVVGQPDASLLVQVLRGADGVSAMPEDGPPVQAEEIAAVAFWIRAGSPPPEGDSESTPTLVSKHWAFQPVEEPTVPVSADPWPSNPIDSFLLATHVAHCVKAVAGLQPSRFCCGARTSTSSVCRLLPMTWIASRQIGRRTPSNASSINSWRLPSMASVGGGT